MSLFRTEWRIAALKNGFQDATAYRIEFLIEILGYAFVPAAIQMVLWYAIFKVGGVSSVQGMQYADMILYTLVSMLFSQVRGGDHDFELQEMIREGNLSNYLLRPVGVVEFVYIRGAASRLFVAMISLVLGCIASAFITELSVVRMLSAMLIAVMGNIIHYQLGAILATTAFYWEEAFSVLMVKNMVVGLLSGELLPLNLFPKSFEWVWKSTPFYLYVFGPVQIALGKWTYGQFLESFIIGAAWMIALFFGIRLSWKVGLKKYVSIGG